MTSEGDQPDVDASADALETLLAEAGPGVFSEEVQREVDAVLAPGLALEPGARQKLIEAAKRGTRQWNLREHAALETLLFEARRRRDQEADAIAERLGIGADTIRSIERGESGLGTQPASVLASWALEVNLDRDVLGAALRRSLGTLGAAPAYAGERHLRLEPDQEQFVEDVLRAYDERVTGATG